MILNERLSDRLGLTEEQQERIDALMAERRAEATRILEEVGPFLQAQLDSMEAEIREILTPEQQERFDLYRGESRGLFGRHPGDRLPPGRGLP